MCGVKGGVMARESAGVGLTKTVGVWERMHKHGGLRDGEDPVEFWQLNEDTGGRLRSVHLDRDLVVELGDPDELTITIEPGDRLND